MKIGFDSIIGKTLGRTIYKGAWVGMELEYEHSTDTPAGLDKGWYTDIDHSLRTGGIEFISVPTRRKDIPAALKVMIKAAKSVGSKVTPRCGLHIHVNVTDLTWAEMYKFVTYYTLLEPLLFAVHAPGRELSHFCVPTWTNTSLCEYMYIDGQRLRSGINLPDITTTNWTKVAQHMNPLMSPGRAILKMLNTPKYAALNMAALKKFGTLEFRQAPSSLNPDFIREWATLLLNIRKVSRRYEDATDIVRAYDRYGILNLCAEVGFFPNKKADTMDQEDAADAATVMAGHVPVDWKQLEWEIK